MDAAAPSEAHLGPGLRLPGLTIVSSLHTGARSTVYLAHQDRSGREIVVKVLRPDVEDPAAWHAFRREARAASRLHPAIASVYAAGRTPDGRQLVVMERLADGSLDERLRFGEPLTPEAVRDLGVALSGALSAAHGNGIIHGEVGPSRVMFTESGAPKLTGFGLSAQLRAPRGSRG